MRSVLPYFLCFLFSLFRSAWCIRERLQCPRGWSNLPNKPWSIHVSLS